MHRRNASLWIHLFLACVSPAWCVPARATLRKKLVVLTSGALKPCMGYRIISLSFRCMAAAVSVAQGQDRHFSSEPHGGVA